MSALYNFAQNKKAFVDALAAKAVELDDAAKSVAQPFARQTHKGNAAIALPHPLEMKLFQPLRFVALAALALLISSPSTPAKAEFEIRNVASGLVVDVIGAHTNDLQGVILFPANNRKNQLFDEVSQTLDGSFSLVARHSAKCLDVDGASDQNGVPIIQFKRHFGPNQRWTSQRVGRGVILKAVHSGKCLDARNPNFPTPPRSDAPLQQFACISNESDRNAVNQIFQLGGF
jgi:Ricin-type beta-trefoil lectin domain-like